MFVSLIFVTILKVIPGINILGKIALVWGTLIIVYALLRGYKRRKIYKFDLFLQAFLAITFLLILVFYRSRYNFICWIVNCILFMSVFSIDIFRNKKELINEINTISYSYTMFMLVASIMSLFMKFTNATIKANNYIFTGSQGGVFENENAIAIAAAIAIVLCIYISYCSRDFKIKTYLIINIFIQGIVLINFNGRSGLLILIGMIYTYIYIYIKNKYIRGILILLPFISMLIIYNIFDFTTIRLFTSGRYNLWRAAYVVIGWYPFVGVGGSDLVNNILEAKVTYDLPGLEFGGLHNIYVQIATENGIISLILFLLFLCGMMLLIVKKIDILKKKEKIKMTVLMSLLVGILAVNIFESSLVYIVSFISIIFWTFSGYLISILDNRNFS